MLINVSRALALCYLQGCMKLENVSIAASDSLELPDSRVLTLRTCWMRSKRLGAIPYESDLQHDDKPGSVGYSYIII